MVIEYSEKAAVNTLQLKERLAADNSAKNLTDEELLTLLISSGTREQDAVSLMEMVLKQSQGLKGLSQLSFEEIAAFKGIGKSKGAKIMAALEIGRRISYVFNSQQSVVLDGTKAAAQLLMEDMANLEQEVFKVCLLNAKNHLLALEMIAMGSANCAYITIKDILRVAFKKNAYAIILAHNHPQCEASPSESDIVMTKSLKKTLDVIGMPILDHIIIGENGYYSFREQKMME